MVIQPRDLGELGQNLQEIIKRLAANQNLLKLLYYSDDDPLSGADITPEIYRQKIYDKLIKITPRVLPKETEQSLIAITVTRGTVRSDNDQFQDISLKIDVITPLRAWMIKDVNLRPFKILGEIHKSLNNKEIKSVGRLRGGDFELTMLTDEVSGYTASYNIIDYE